MGRGEQGGRGRRQGRVQSFLLLLVVLLQLVQHAACLHYSGNKGCMRDLKQIPLRSQDRQTLRRFTSEGLSETSSRKVHGDVLRVRGGGSLDFSRPETVFNTYLAGLAAFCALLRVVGLSGSNKVVSVANEKYQKLKTNYLAVFWAFKLADWLHGPYFYSVYASKKHNGKPLGEDLIGKLFLCGFGASMIFGTVAGSLVDTIGRKAGCLAFGLIYSLSALSTRAASLPFLLLGRVLGGTATSLLFSAPEAWLVGEHGKQGLDGSLLGEIFEMAYFGDGLVAILAGKLAGYVAAREGGKGSWLSGPSGPFELSVLFLSLGTALVGLSWGENYGGNQKVSASKKNIFTSLRDAMRIILDDRKILLTGLIQSLFEGAMYIFVLQWPPAMARVMSSSPPYGTIFACLMTACMIGSSLFGILMKTSMMIETIMIGMLGCSSIALALAGHIMHHLPDASFAMHVLAGCFLLFEVGVGMYFPSIGTLRSKYIDNEHKAAVMNIFRIPLNLIVISVYLQIGRLGVSGALLLASIALSAACLGQIFLRGEAIKAKEQEKQ